MRYLNDSYGRQENQYQTENIFDYTQVLSTYNVLGDNIETYEYAGRRQTMTNPLGVSDYRYDGYGNVDYVMQNNRVSSSYTYDPWGEMTSGAPAQGRIYGYNGEQYTVQTNQQYLRARNYSPEMKTFTTQDEYLGVTNLPISQNRYIYAYNNPTFYDDPSGMYPVRGHRMLPENTLNQGLHQERGWSREFFETNRGSIPIYSLPIGVPVTYFTRLGAIETEEYIVNEYPYDPEKVYNLYYYKHYGSEAIMEYYTSTMIRTQNKNSSSQANAFAYCPTVEATYMNAMNHYYETVKKDSGFWNQLSNNFDLQMQGFIEGFFSFYGEELYMIQEGWEEFVKPANLAKVAAIAVLVGPSVSVYNFLSRKVITEINIIDARQNGDFFEIGYQQGRSFANDIQDVALIILTAKAAEAVSKAPAVLKQWAKNLEKHIEVGAPKPGTVVSGGTAGSGVAAQSNWGKVIAGFNSKEQKILTDAKKILDNPEFAKILKAHQSGEYIEININGYKVSFLRQIGRAHV